MPEIIRASVKSAKRLFDIVNFYLSISEDLFNKSKTFAESLVKISDRDANIIYHLCQSFLFNEDGVWDKKGKGGKFDVSLDGQPY